MVLSPLKDPESVISLPNPVLLIKKLTSIGIQAGGRERKVREEGGKPKLFCKDVIHVSLVLRAYPN